MKKHILLGIIGIGCSIGSAVVGMMTYEDKRTEMNRQVNAAVDQRFMQLIDSQKASDITTEQ